MIGWDNSDVARIRNGYIRPPGKCPAITLTGEDFNVVVGTLTRGKAVRLVLANDSYEHPATFRVSAANDRRVQSVVTSWNARFPDDLNASAAEWSLGPAGCVLVELAP